MREMSGKKTLIHNAVYTVNHSVVMNTITNVNKVIFLKKGKKIYQYTILKATCMFKQFQSIL